LVEWRWQGKPKYSEKICPSATLSTTNPTCQTRAQTWPLRGGKPAANHLSYGAAISLVEPYESKMNNHVHNMISWCLEPLHTNQTIRKVTGSLNWAIQSKAVLTKYKPCHPFTKTIICGNISQKYKEWNMFISDVQNNQ
jgi:hypothetical protein